MRFGLLAGFVGLLVGFGLGTAGCSNGGEEGDPRLGSSGQARPEILTPADLPPLGSLELVVTSEPRVRLGFKQSAVIEALLTDGEGNPVVGSSVSFGLLGRPQDASLERIITVTDEDGLASTTLITGAKPAAFSVRVSAPGAYDQLVDVAVSNAGFGTLAVRARYYGPRAANERTVVTKAGGECDKLTEDGVGDAMMRLAKGQDEVQFLALPANLDYAVLGYAFGADGTVVAQGCLEGVRVRADGATNVVIQYRDQPINVGGELALHAELRSKGVATTLLATALNASTAAVVNDASGRPAPDLAEARFLLDSLDGVLRSDAYKDRPSMRSLADDLREARLLQSGAQRPDVALGDLLEARREGALYVVDAFGKHSSVVLARLGLDATLKIDGSVDPLELGVRTTRLTALGVKRGQPPVVLDLPLDAEPVLATAVLASEADQLLLEPSEIDVAFGALALQVMRRVASTEVLGEGAELRAALGCKTLQDWLLTRAAPGPSMCDQECIDAMCERAMARLLGAAETALLGLDVVRPTVTLSGPFELDDEDGDLRAEQMNSEALSGAWTAPSSELPNGDLVCGTATATAPSPLPAAESER